MSMKNGASTLLAAIFLAGCAQTRLPPTDTYDRIGRELATAADSQPRNGALPEPVGRAMLPELALDAPVSAPPAALAEARFDLAVNDAPVSQVLMAIASGTRYNMLVPPEVSGRVTLNLKNVTLRETLDTLRDLYGYDYSVKDNRILIKANTLQSRMFKINYLAARRTGSSDVRVTSSSIAAALPQQGTPTAASAPGGLPQPASPGGGAGSRQSNSSEVRMTTDQDFWSDLKTALDALLAGRDGAQAVINPGSGVVVVRALPGDMRNVEEYLRATQAVVERQVMLEAKIIEVALNEEFQSGVNWSVFNGKNNRWQTGVLAPGTTLQGDGKLATPDVTSYPGRYVDATYGGLQTTALGKGFFGLAFQSATFAALLNFLETQGSTQVLSSPRIATLNNQKAVLKVGTDEFFVTNVTSNVTSSGTSTVSAPTISLAPFFSGIALDVTPQIDSDGNIILHVHPSISQVTEKQKSVDLGTLGNYTLPLASSKVNESDAIVRVADGQIVAIGGLMAQEQSIGREGLPGLSGMSGIGALFGQRNKGFRKVELVILLKPTVIQGDAAWRPDLLDAQERLRDFDPRRDPLTR